MATLALLGSHTHASVTLTLGDHKAELPQPHIQISQIFTALPDPGVKISMPSMPIEILWTIP